VTRFTLPSLFLILAAILAIPGGVAGRRGPASRADLEQYRNYFIEEEDAEPKNGSVKVTFLGAATLLFDDGDTQLMIDGFFSRPSLFQVARKIETNTQAVDAALKKAKVNHLKALFVAHTHFDHALDAAYIIQKTGAKLYGSVSTLNVGRGGNLNDEQMVLYEPEKEVKLGKFGVTVLKSKHSPPMKGINDDLGETIDKPLKQPAMARDYKEGGSFDFLIRQGDGVVLVMPSCNYIEGALDKVRADVLFLGTATLGSQTRERRNTFYDQTVQKVQPKLLIPIHWDNFFMPLSERLEPPGKAIDDTAAGFDFLIERLKANKIRFGILQGYQSVMLFGQSARPMGGKSPRYSR
jgi:L-ascorbate metabolism protein UlaG (beta-lactamase superfamily)